MNKASTQHIGIIDLGSNTARLVIMQARPGYAYRLEDEIREVVRLREGLGPGGLSNEAMARGLSTLRLFQRFCDSMDVDLILPTATSAVRDASNRGAFLEHVRQETGLSLRLLSGEREAYYGAIGALNEVPLDEGVVLDIGGGSIQLSRISRGEFACGVSLPLGALALSTRFINQDPPAKKEIRAVQDEIARHVDGVPWLTSGNTEDVTGRLVGLGGTIRNLAKIEAARQNYPLYTLHGFTLTYSSVQESIEEFVSQPLSKRQSISGLSSDRADIILPGALVLATIMQRLQMNKLTLSLSGLREGIFFEKFWQHLPYPVNPNVQLFGVLNLARNYQYKKLHANHVRYLTRRLFEQLQPLHGYTRPDRHLLDTAALLHDVGTIISYDRHHKHSQTLVEYNGLPGFTPREIALVALLVRYHRKGNPSLGDYRSILDKDDKRLLTVLAAMLRLAEFLERGRNASVDDIIARWNEGTLRLTLVADDYPAVEMWEAQRSAIPLMSAAFGRETILDSLIPPV